MTVVRQWMRWLESQVVGEVPPEIHACEACHEIECSAERMRTCPQRELAAVSERSQNLVGRVESQAEPHSAGASASAAVTATPLSHAGDAVLSELSPESRRIDSTPPFSGTRVSQRLSGSRTDEEGGANPSPAPPHRSNEIEGK